MKKTGIIGLGTITKHYIKGLAESPLLKLVAVCDKLEKPASSEYYKDYAFYRDYKEMIEACDLDYVIISTPPATHNEIATWALSHGVNVIVEKPAVLDMKQYRELLKLAEKNNLIFEVMFHWQNGSEVLKFNEMFDAGKISEISVEVLDPYSEDEINIDEAKVKLEGGWIDSGVNILSMLRLWLPFDKYSVDNMEIQRCKTSNLPVFVNMNMHIDGGKVNINIDWRVHKNNKCTWVVHDGKKIVINHSMQQLQYEDGTFTDCYIMDRLPYHYYNYFKNYNENVDTDLAEDIHRILLEVEEYYEKICN